MYGIGNAGAASVRQPLRACRSPKVLPPIGLHEKSGPGGAALHECDVDRERSSWVSPSGGRPPGRVAMLRFGKGRLRRESRSVPPVPLNPRAEGQGHRRKDRQRHGEARQDRLHRNHLDGSSAGEGLRRPGGLPRKIPGFASPPHDGFALDGGPSRSEHRFMCRTLPGVRQGSHTPLVLVGVLIRVSAPTHHPPWVSVRRARSGRPSQVVASSARGRAWRPPPRSRPRCRSAHRRR